MGAAHIHQLSAGKLWGRKKDDPLQIQVTASTETHFLLGRSVGPTTRCTIQ